MEMTMINSGLKGLKQGDELDNVSGDIYESIAFIILKLKFCETQGRHSVKIRLYNTPYPILPSVKRSDVTRWKQGYITPPIPYFILWNAGTSLCENKVI